MHLKTTTFMYIDSLYECILHILSVLIYNREEDDEKRFLIIRCIYISFTTNNNIDNVSCANNINIALLPNYTIGKWPVSQ